MKTLIIAEAGVNHNGNMDYAFRLIDVAAECGADLIKFQTFKADLLVTQDALKADYQKQTTDLAESQYEMLKRLELSREAHLQLMDHCKSRDIKFFSTGFDTESINLLAELGQDCFKIPSGEITNLPYLRYVGRHAKSIIISTGMSTLGEIEAALEIFQKSDISIENITVLHCNTEYPTPMIDVNLRAMNSIRDAFGVAVGYSDHTPGIEVAIAAVALGATVIEKHITLDRNLPGPDHKASLEPPAFKAMVTAIRNIEQALGSRRKWPSASEEKNKFVVRKSIVAAKPINVGEKFTIDNLTTKRPGTGISPMRWDEFMGKKSSRNYVVNELIEE